MEVRSPIPIAIGTQFIALILDLRFSNELLSDLKVYIKHKLKRLIKTKGEYKSPFCKSNMKGS